MPYSCGSTSCAATNSTTTNRRALPMPRSTGIDAAASSAAHTRQSRRRHRNEAQQRRQCRQTIGCGKPMTLKPNQIKMPTPKLTATAIRETRQAIAGVVEHQRRQSNIRAPAMRMNDRAAPLARQNEDEHHDDDAGRLNVTQMEPNTRWMTCKELAGASCKFDGMALATRDVVCGVVWACCTSGSIETLEPAPSAH